MEEELIPIDEENKDLPTQEEEEPRGRSRTKKKIGAEESSSETSDLEDEYDDEYDDEDGVMDDEEREQVMKKFMTPEIGNRFLTDLLKKATYDYNLLESENKKLKAQRENLKKEIIRITMENKRVNALLNETRLKRAKDLMGQPSIDHKEFE